MNKLFHAIIIVPALFAMLACGAVNENALPEDNGVDQITNPSNTDPLDPMEEIPEVDDSDDPEVAEENPCQGIPGGCKAVLAQLDTSVLTAIAQGKSSELKDALTLHAAVINAHQGTWSQASNEEKAEMVATVEKGWNNFLGYDNLDDLRADVEEAPQETLNKFLRFYVYTVFKGPEGNFSQGEFEAIGGINLAAFQHLDDAIYKLEHGHPLGGGEDLLKFAELLPKPNLTLQVAFLRIHLLSAAKRFGLKGYFGDVKADDPAYEKVSQDFSISLASDLLARFRNYGASPGQEYKTCNANPKCSDKVVEAYSIMALNLPALWEKVAFKMTDANGQEHVFSFLNFVHVPSNGKMFGLARGTFGVHKIESLKLANPNEI